MVQYIYMSFEHENKIANAIDKWEKKNGWTCIIGVYKETLILDESNSKVKNIHKKDREKVVIKKGYKDTEHDKIYGIVGFCLEGDVELLVPDVYTEMKTLSNVYFFNSNIDYLNWIEPYLQMI